MRDLIVTENITLDGVIEATEGWFAPAAGEDDLADVETALRKQREDCEGQNRAGDTTIFSRARCCEPRRSQAARTHESPGTR